MYSSIELPNRGIIGRKLTTNKPLPPASDLDKELARGKQKVAEKVDEWTEYQNGIKKVCNLIWFDLAIGFVIFVNAVEIGVDQSFDLNGNDTTGTKIVESICLCIYVLELLLRFLGFGLRESLKSNWIRFDLLLVLLGVITSWIVEPVLGQKTTGLGPIMILRMLRLFRIARIFRLLRLLTKIPEFWVMIRGFLNGSNIVLCTIIIFTLALYVFGCLSVELITKHALNQSDPEFKEHVDQHFPNLTTAMLTLVRFAVLDNTSEVYAPLVTKDPWLFIYFGVVLLVISVVTFNLLGAVIFNSIIEQGVQENDSHRKAQQDEWSRLMTDLKRMFLRLDKDGSGHLSKEEIKQIHPSDMEQLAKALRCSTPLEVFQCLDVDGSGEISIAEFFDGALEIIMDEQDKKALGLKRMEKQVETMHWRLKDLFTTQHELDLKIGRILEELGSLKAIKVMTSGACTPSTLPPDDDELQRGHLPCRLSEIKEGKALDLKALTASCHSQTMDIIEQLPRELKLSLQQIWEASMLQSLELTLRQAQHPQVKSRSERRPTAAHQEASKASEVNSYSCSESFAQPLSGVDLRDLSGPHHADVHRKQPLGSSTSVSEGSQISSAPSSRANSRNAPLSSLAFQDKSLTLPPETPIALGEHAAPVPTASTAFRISKRCQNREEYAI